MVKDIVIFGKNSILAKNFVENKYSKFNKYIFITRENNSNNEDIFCDLGRSIKRDEINNICQKIENLCLNKEKVFILFAWSGGPRNYLIDSENWQINNNIIKNFLLISKRLLPEKIIFISSSGAIYPQNQKKEFTEADKTIPLTAYGKQKLISENIIKSFGQENNLNFTILRVATAYGFDPRFSDQGVINKWIYAAINNKQLKLLNSKKSLINFISFSQISEAINLSISKHIYGTYNIGCSKSISLEDLIKEIELVCNKKLSFYIENNETRYCNINVNKFEEITGKVFKNQYKIDLKNIFHSIKEFKK